MEIIIILLIVFVLTMISLGISHLIGKTHKGYVFIVPSIYTLLTVASVIIAYSLDSWAGLGYMIIAILFFISAIASWIVSLVLYTNYKKR